MRNLFFLMLGIVLVCLLASCRKFQRVVYYRTLQPERSGWQSDVPLVFSADSTNAAGLEPGQCQLFMVMRYRETIPYSKLHLRLEFTSLMRGVRQRDITLNMEYPASNPGAKVKLNKGLVEVVIPLGYDYVDQGWTLAVQQRMAPPPLTEIYDVGIKMIKE